MSDHDTGCGAAEQAHKTERREVMEQVTQLFVQSVAGSELADAVTRAEAPPRKRGRPLKVSSTHLWLSLLLAVLGGMHTWQDWCRFVGTGPIGPFAPVWMTSTGLVKRLLKAGTTPLEQLWEQVTAQLHAHFVVTQTCEDAAFASQIVCLDETKLDAVHRYLKPLRALPAGAVGLSAGKVLGLFEVRSQQWLRLEWREKSLENCKVDVLDFLAGLAVGSLLLFDLGYFSFVFFDQLTQQGWWWISRSREKTTYQVAHVFYRHHEVLDALVWLGSGSTQAGHMVRLVRFGDGQQVRMYLTNVLSPHQLSIAAIARLYARRWDIESAFRVLKDYLGMNQWWSSKQELIWVQIWVVLMLAHVLTALQVQIAVQSGRDPFEVSLPLLLKLLPQLRRYQQNIVEWVCEHGEQVGVLRASPRLKVRVPQVALADYREAPPQLQTQRRAHRVIYEAGPPKPSYSGYNVQAAKRRGGVS